MAEQADQGTVAAGAGSEDIAPATSAPVAERPDWLPESYWDGENKAPRADALKADFNELTQFRSDAEARTKDVPKDADGYKIELPEGFEVPEGLKFTPDPADPMYKQFQTVAHKAGLSQGQARQIVGLYADMQLAQRAAGETAIANETKALGDKAGERIDAARRWLNATVNEPQAKMLGYALNTKDGVEAVEALMAKASGVKPRGLPNGNGQDAGPSPLDRLYPTMAAARS